MTPPLNLNPADAVALGAESLILFGNLFLPKTFRQKSPKFHHDIGNQLYSDSRKNELLCFRGSAKTTLLRTFALQRAAYGISRTIMYTSSSQGHAIHSIRWLKKQVETNTRLSPFGLRPGSKWTDEWIEIVHGVEGYSINVFAVGITGQTRGFNLDDYRPDLIIGDDILDEENSATKEQRGKVEDRLFGSLMNSLAPASEAPRAKAIIAQTPFNNNDVSMKISKDEQWNTRVYSCFDEMGKSRWEERFSTETLQAEKASYMARGMYRIWMREMECQVVVSEDKALDATKLRYWTTLPPGLRKVITIDPASSDSPKADQHVVMVVGALGSDFFVCAYDAAQGITPDKASSKFFEYSINFAPISRAGVETTAYQRVLKWHLEQEMTKRRIWVPIQPLQPTERKANRIIFAIAGLLNYGHLYVHESMATLVEQLDEYDPEDKDAADDILDALAMGIVMLNPALQTLRGGQGETFEGEWSYVDEEKEYPRLAVGGCP